MEAVRTLAVVFWLLFGAAIWSYALGNPTAINGIIGAGVCAVVVTSLAIIEQMP